MKYQMNKILIILMSLTIMVNIVVSVNPMTVEDVSTLNNIDEYASSYEGTSIAYSVSTWDKSSNTSGSYIKGKNVYSSNTYDITSRVVGFSFESNIVFTQFEGKAGKMIEFIFFLRNGIMTYAKFENKKLEVEKTLDFPVPLNKFKIKSGILAFTAFVYPEFGNDLGKTKTKDKVVQDQGPDTFAVYDRIPVYTFNSWNTGKVVQIFTVNLKYDADNEVISLDGTPVNRLSITDPNSKVILFCQPQSTCFDLKPDGSELAVSILEDNLASLAEGSYEKYLEVKTYLISLVSQDTKRIFITNGTDENLKYSPNGNIIAFLEKTNKNSQTDYLKLKLIENGNIKKLAAIDSNINEYTWFNDYIILFTAPNNGYNKLGFLRLDLPDQTPIFIHNDADLASTHGSIVKLNNSTRVFVLKSAINKLPELYSFSMKLFESGQSPAFTPFTNVNSATINERLNFFEPKPYKNKKGEDIHAFLVKPVNFDNQKKYPLIMAIHGGPQGAHTNQWMSLVVNPILLARDKYMVLLPNPHGSTGFGQSFSKAVEGDWGSQPANDLLDGVASLKDHANVDYAHKCVAGLSYGGYMTNLLRGKVADSDVKFNCYVTIDGIFDIRTVTYSTGGSWFMLQQMCGENNPFCLPYDSKFKDKFDIYSPEKLISKWDKAPHFVAHGQKDYILTWSEGSAMFTALQLNNIESKYFLFLEESHIPMWPTNTIAFEKAVNAFVDEKIMIEIPK